MSDRATEIAETISEPPQAGPTGEAHDGPSNWLQPASAFSDRPNRSDATSGRPPPRGVSRVAARILCIQNGISSSNSNVPS